MTENIRPTEEDTWEEYRWDHFFDPYRVPSEDNASELVDEALQNLKAYENHHGLRQRKRRPADEERLRAAVTAVICDVAYQAVTNPERGVAISLSKRILGRKGRYSAPAYTKVLPKIIDILSSEEVDMLVVEKGEENPFRHSRRTTLWPGGRLNSRLMKCHFMPDDFRREDRGEVIILKRTKEDFWDLGEVVDYPDDETTNRYRDEVEAINAWLRDADITVHETELPDSEVWIDSRKRRLSRTFTKGSFESGGRLFGGFWMGIPKAQRFKALSLDGEPVAELDYSQMAPRILYSLAGKELPVEDGYRVPGYEANREGIKKLFNSLLFAPSRPQRFPKGTRSLFPKGVTVDSVLTSIEKVHDPVREHFYSGIGHRLQFIESQILVRVLLLLKEEGVVALPIHDAVLVPSSSTELSREAMIKVFEDFTGAKAQVTVEDL